MKTNGNLGTEGWWNFQHRERWADTFLGKSLGNSEQRPTNVCALTW